MMAQRPRLPATSVRAKRYGQANQISYEVNERAEREASLARMASDTARRRAMAARPKPAQSGMNAGTMGGARGLKGSWLSVIKGS